tara:strand:- start:59 stop:940 length:882 start_codon:yes stop_codon:yes gene_type:complete
MLNFNKFIFFLIIFSTGIYTEDFETPYEIKSGDINSSELINYQNQNLKDRLKTWSSIDLVGKWSCNLYTDDNSIWTSYAATFGSFEGIYKTSVPHVYTFKNDGDGTFSVESSINLGLIVGNGGTAKSYSLIGNVIFNSGMYAHFSPISKTRFLLSMQSVWIESSYRKSVEICDKTHQSSNPNNSSNSETWLSLPISDHPTNFKVISATAGGPRTLSWTDNSSNETGFKIYRKDLANGSFSLLANIALNETNYVDSTSISGDKVLWYKVVPVSASGDGKPSKVVRIRYNDPNTP